MTRYTRTINIFIALKHIQFLMEEAGESGAYVEIIEKFKEVGGKVTDKGAQLGQIMLGARILNDGELRNYERAIPLLLSKYNCMISSLSNLDRAIVEKYAPDVKKIFGEDVTHKFISNHHKPNPLSGYSDIMRGIWRVFWLCRGVNGALLIRTNVIFLYNEGSEARRAFGIAFGKGNKIWDAVCEIVYNDKCAWMWSQRNGNGKAFVISGAPILRGSTARISGILTRFDHPEDDAAIYGANTAHYCLYVRLSSGAISDDILTGICGVGHGSSDHLKSSIDMALSGGHVDKQHGEVIGNLCLSEELTPEEFSKRYSEFGKYFLEAKESGGVVSEFGLLDDFVRLLSEPAA